MAGDALALDDVLGAGKNAGRDQRRDHCVGAVLLVQGLRHAAGLVEALDADEFGRHERERGADRPVGPHRQSGQEHLVKAVEHGQARHQGADPLQLEQVLRGVLDADDAHVAAELLQLVQTVGDAGQAGDVVHDHRAVDRVHNRLVMAQQAVKVILVIEG